MESKQEQAVKTFSNNYNCAQAVFSTFSHDLGLSRDVALRLSTPFGAGMVYMQETCGAVSGALMAIGLKYGKGENGTQADRERAYDMAQHFIAEFKKLHGTTNCLKLLNNVQISTPEGMSFAIENQLFKTRCAGYITDAVAIVEKIVGAQIS